MLSLKTWPSLPEIPHYTLSVAENGEDNTRNSGEQPYTEQQGPGAGEAVLMSNPDNSSLSSMCNRRAGMSLPSLLARWDGEGPFMCLLCLLAFPVGDLFPSAAGMRLAANSGTCTYTVTAHFSAGSPSSQLPADQILSLKIPAGSALTETQRYR